MIVLKYTLFALLSIAVNLLVQYLSFLLYSGFGAIYLALLTGTLAGLVVKYVLDKRYIFYHETKSHRENTVKFMLYSFMGVFTTIIFWGFELAFDALIAQAYAKYLGGLIGLVIGYVVKYRLDKEFVFRSAA